MTALPSQRAPLLPTLERRLVPGRSLGRYELLCPIAQGGMATVWVARLRGVHGFEKLVAIKTMLSELASDERYQSMLLDEARLVAGIRHQNVAEILDLGGEDSLLYIVLEWIEGDSLSTLHRTLRAQHRRMPLNLALRVVAQTCAGLHAAHELKDRAGRRLNVVHRDVSPQNVLVSAAGEVKLIDFGIAKAMGRGVDETQPGIVKGKIAFMAPEQALGQRVDRRADVWAAGVMLYQLLSGELPYQDKNSLATLHLITSGRRPAKIPSLPPRLTALIERALEPDVDKRLATAEEFESELEAVIATQGSVTTRDLAQVVSDCIGKRIESKRETIDTALRAAEERSKLLLKFEAAIADARASISDDSPQPNPRALELRPPETENAQQTLPEAPAEIASLLEVAPVPVRARSSPLPVAVGSLAVVLTLAAWLLTRSAPNAAAAAAVVAAAAPRPVASTVLAPPPETATNAIEVSTRIAATAAEPPVAAQEPATKPRSTKRQARATSAPPAPRGNDVFNAFSERR